MFPTAWGYFGLLGTSEGLVRTCLPIVQDHAVERRLLEDGPANYCRGLFPELQRAVRAFFEGERTDLGPCPALDLPRATAFMRSVYAACRRIPFGGTATYARLAETAGSAGAARAVGRCMAVNPMPLVIPCHRVLRGDGGLGGFSAQGGLAQKQRLLDHEAAVLNSGG